MAPAPGIWAPLAMGLLRNALKKTTSIVQKRLAEVAARSAAREPIPILIRNTPRHPISKAAWLRQSKGRWYTTHSTINANIRRFIHSSPVSQTVKSPFGRSSYPASSVGSAVRATTFRAPFASTLRPNLTGGALPRTAGGYSIGGSRAGGARYFSHSPAAPAQVVHNASAAMRCFWLSGSKAQYDGVNSRGEKQYRTVSALQDKAGKKMSQAKKFSPGSFVDFKLTPAMTALSPLGAAAAQQKNEDVEVPTLNTEGFMDVLSVDFARALKDYAAIMRDLQQLQTLGGLTITLEPDSVLRVRFPGCDADTVEALCQEVNVMRGVIGQDPDFDSSYGQAMALQFPFASMTDKALTSPALSLRSETGYAPYAPDVESFVDEGLASEMASDDMEMWAQVDAEMDNPWLSSPEEHSTVDEDALGDFETPQRVQSISDGDQSYMEGFYKFMETRSSVRS